VLWRERERGKKLLPLLRSEPHHPGQNPFLYQQRNPHPNTRSGSLIYLIILKYRCNFLLIKVSTPNQHILVGIFTISAVSTYSTKCKYNIYKVRKTTY
jgi:hypothetical protein